eukprot:SAG31_NODE_18789_length_622_cov_1.558317_1_plen_60_part_10
MSDQSAFLCASHSLLGNVPAALGRVSNTHKNCILFFLVADGYSLDGVSWHLSPTTPYNCT